VRAFGTALTAMLVAVLILPTAALAAGVVQIGVFQNNPPTYTPIPGATVGLYEHMTMMGWNQVDEDVSGITGYTPWMSAPDMGDGDYAIRVWKPGFVTWDSYPTTYRIPPTTGVNPKMEVDPLRTERVWGNDRYTTAVKIARERFTSPANPTLWLGVDTVVIASGEDRAAADPLAAAGLCGLYDAPLFLVRSTGVPGEVMKAVEEIFRTRASTRVILVGGPLSVPDSIFNQLNSMAPDPLIKDRIISTGDRYDLAAAIALRIKSKMGNPWHVLVANGADPAKFFDALALSPVSASSLSPILLVRSNSIPAATKNALTAMGNPPVIIGGGPLTVSDGVMAELASVQPLTERWWGSDRYKTAIAIADKALAKGWLDDECVAVAAKLPDALTGGSTVGQWQGPLLITRGDSLTGATGDWLATHKGAVKKCYVFGGPLSVTDTVKNNINSKLQ
jgi:lactocepin